MRKEAAGNVMLFTSLEFLIVFFPVVLTGYFLLPHRFRNYWLLFASLFFYAWGEPKFVYNMVFTILWSYLMALRIEELPGGARGGGLCWPSPWGWIWGSCFSSNI